MKGIIHYHMFIWLCYIFLTYLDGGRHYILLHSSCPRFDQRQIQNEIYPNNKSTIKQDMPNSGMFMSNCAHHVTLANPTTWSAMPVPTIDSNDQTSVTLNQVRNF